MKIDQTIKENQKKIDGLMTSLKLYLNTPNASLSSVKKKVDELQEHALFRRKQLEVKGQEVLIEALSQAIAALKLEA